MSKVFVGAGLKRVSWRRMQTVALERSSPGPYSDGGSHEKTMREGAAMPAEHWFPRAYSTGPNYNRKGGDRKGLPTMRQKKIAVQVMEVISGALQQGPCYNEVLPRCGFQILKVKMSSDLRTAHILWTALPGMQRTAEKAVISKVLHLRSLVFQSVSLPFSPVIKFEEDKPSQEMLALDAAFAKLKEEEDEVQRVKDSDGEDQRQNGAELEKRNSSVAPP